MRIDDKVISLHRLCKISKVGYVNIHEQLKRRPEERTIKKENINKLIKELEKQVEKFKKTFYE